MNFRLNIQPRFVLAATVLVAVLMVSSALIELQQSREELYHIMREEAVSLSATIGRGSTNALLSMGRIEDLLAERLHNNAEYIARIDSMTPLRGPDLAAIAEENRLYRVNIFDRRGIKVLSSVSPTPGHEDLAERHSPRDYLEPILSGSVDRLVIGVKEARYLDGQRFAVAVRRKHPSGGAVVVNIDAAELLEFRRAVGIGKLIRDLADSSGILYVALQDPEGIIAASGSVRELTSIADDSTLRHSMAMDTTLTRVTEFNGSSAFEVVRPFALEGERVGVLRIALSMDEVRSAEARMYRRMIIMSLVVVIIGALAIVLLMSQQSFRVIEKKYASIKTFTGNILAQMRDGVITVDPGGKVTIFNNRAADLLSADGDMVEGQLIRDLANGPASRLQAIFDRHDGASEILLERPDGTHRIADVSLSTTLDSRGEVESRTAVLRDMTETRRLEREAQRREKLSAMGELASSVAHEIRNPLNAIAMIAQRFEKEYTPRSGVKEFRALTRVMRDEARRVNAIIRQFLSFARPPAIQRRPVDVAGLVSDVASLIALQASGRGIIFSASTDGHPVISLDPEQMKQALLNVLQNALEATDRGGRVTFACVTAGPSIRFTVSDTGRGIPSSSLDKIFNLYFTTRAEGTGLGLSITHQIVAQHGGTIDVSSVEGKGTVFTLEIPSK